MLILFRFCSLLSLWCLFVITHGYSDVEYLTEESQRLDKYAKKLKDNLHHELDPCEHFLEYVNGSIDASLPEQNYGVIFDIIKPQIYDVPVIKNYYLSCENRKRVNYFEAVKDLNIKEEIMSFPILDRDWVKYNYSLEEFEARFMPFLPSFLLGEAIKTKNGDYKFKIEPSFATFTLSENTMKNVLRYYKVNSQEIIDQTLTDVKQYESYYRQVLKNFDIVLNPFEKPKKMNLGELKEKYPNFNWDRYFSIISGGANFNDNAEVSVIYENKIGYFYDFYPKEINTTVALYYLFKLHSSLQGVYNTGYCGVSTIVDLCDVVINEVLQDYVDPHDMISFTDTITAMSKTPDLITRTEIDLETISKLLSLKDDYSKYVASVYGLMTLNQDNFLSNYVKIKTLRKLRAIPEEFTITYHRALHILPFAHLKPRLVLLAMWKLWDCYDANSQMETIMDFIDNLEQLDSEKYQNELNTLVKYNLTPRKLLFILLGNFSVYVRDIKTFQENIRAMRTFNNEFNCPIDSESSYKNKCKKNL